MKHAYDSPLFHALKMALRNRRSYAFLSVTIVLSFSLLLALFLFSDSYTYNRYKDLFSVSREITRLGVAYQGFSADMPASVTAERFRLMEEQMERMEDTDFFQYLSVSAELPQYGSVQANIYFVPGFLPFFYMGNQMSGLQKIRFSSEFTGVLGENQVIIDESFYRYLSQSDEFCSDPSIVLPVRAADGRQQLKTFEVIGTCVLPSGLKADALGGVSGHTYVFAPVDSTFPAGDDYLNHGMLIRSGQPLKIYELARTLSLTCNSIAKQQQQALGELRSFSGAKGLVVLALYGLLGVNLYSSFRNALSRREFEIGVKRALGAKKSDIIRQFLYEGLTVMTVNTAVTVWLVLNSALVYKLIQQVVFERCWIIYLSAHSLIMFTVCTVSMSLLYSLIFAVQSANVDLIAYLKHD